MEGIDPPLPAPPPEAATDKELVRRGVAAWKAGHVEEARDILFSLCDRLAKEDKPIPALALSYYGLALADTGKLKEGVEACRVALSYEKGNAEAHLNLARVYLKADAKKKAIETLERGLRVAPGHKDLKKLRQELGLRRGAPIPILPRSNPINVALGKLLHKPKPK